MHEADRDPREMISALPRQIETSVRRGSAPCCAVGTYWLTWLSTSNVVVTFFDIRSSAIVTATVVFEYSECMTHDPMLTNNPSTQDESTAGTTTRNTDAPMLGATPSAAVGRYFRKYAVVSGRASRSEYWWIALLSLVIYGVGGALAGVFQVATAGTNAYGDVSDETTFGAGLISSLLFLYFLATILPNIGLGVRRLHDVSLSGWVILIGIVPFFGSLILFVLSLLSSNPSGQRFDRR